MRTVPIRRIAVGAAIVILFASTSSLRGAEQQEPPAEESGAPTQTSDTEEQASGTEDQNVTDEVTVTARRIEELAQDVPIPMSVVTGEVIEKAGSFNVNRLKEMIPTVQFYSSNPRNSAVAIRGLGSPFGLTNDGIEAGVGLYVDGVFFARPAAATLDFLDLAQVEVLRGPQGTLFGKNTTAGAINVTTRTPSLVPESNFELSYGNYGFLQAKGSFSGPIGSGNRVAGRLSFVGTQRDGTLDNVRVGDDVNDLDNTGFRGQLMFIANDEVVIFAAADYSRQRPDGYAQVVGGVAPTLRPANRQYPEIAADLGYAPPSFNAFDRLTDTDTPWRSNQDLGGASVTVHWEVGPGQLTSVSAYRWWDWKPSNDRDFIGLPVTTISAAPSTQEQWTQELRYAADLTPKIYLVAGTFFFDQSLQPDPFHVQEQGSAAARFLLAPSEAAATPGLLDAYGMNIDFDFDNRSVAGFGQVELEVADKFRLIPGIRYNYDKKELDYDQQVYGGLQTTDPVLIALQRSVLSPLTYQADISDTNLSGQLTLAYDFAETANAYASYSTGFKSVGLNLGGVPTDALGRPILDAAIVDPEDVYQIELGLKTQPLQGVTANFAFFETSIDDYQTQVVNAQVGVLRGYLANAEEVRVRGAEFDGTAQVNEKLSFYLATAYTDAEYVSFPDAPPPLEETGGPQSKDISGSALPGISDWAASFGGEYVHPARFLGLDGGFFGRLDTSYRSEFSSSPSASEYLVVPSYWLANAQIGFRSDEGWSAYLWGRNLLDEEYFELLSAAPGNSGLYVGLPGDPRTFGVTLRRTFGS